MQQTPYTLYLARIYSFYARLHATRHDRPELAADYARESAHWALAYLATVTP